MNLDLHLKLVLGVDSTEIEQDRQCTYNVTLRRFCEIVFAVEKQFCLFICVFMRARVGGGVSRMRARV
jgi:hypothetical protein